jgi:hypothetical protein
MKNQGMNVEGVLMLKFTISFTGITHNLLQLKFSTVKYRGNASNFYFNPYFIWRSF